MALDTSGDIPTTCRTTLNSPRMLITVGSEEAAEKERRISPMKKLNCWEFMECGKEQGGSKTGGTDGCAASRLTEADGFNGGKNAGRMCWAVAGNLCGGSAVGMFVPKVVSCMNCRFYKYVSEEEGENLRFVL